MSSTINYYSVIITIVLILSVVLVNSEVIAAQQRLRQQRKAGNLNNRERKPNIILILTDDQDVELGSLNFMPKTLKAIRDEGAQFRHAYVTTPMCCPSRSSLLTGMYVHNHQVYTNNDNCSSTQWQATYETRSFATYLSNAGYRTGYFGKYLNKYNGSYIPPGWREWGGLIMNSKYYNYSINMNGKKIKHGFDYHKDYYPDLIANDSIAFLRQSKKNNQHKPVMLTMSFPAPHGPEDSAPQFSHLFFNVTTHHTPSYDFAPNPDKQWILQVTKKMEPIHRQFTDLLMTKRLQTLQSVDSAVQRVVEELEALGELDNTYIVYTSDHGYHLGQFGLIKGKSFPFEFDVRVPFLVRGPGVEPGTVVNDIVLNIDLAPTFLDMADVEVPPHMDGRSVLPLFLNSKRNKKWPDTFLIESSGRRETPYLDKLLRATKYSANNVILMASTQSPISTTSQNILLQDINATSTTISYDRTTEAPKIYDSGEEITLKPEDELTDEEGDDEEDDELEEEDDSLVVDDTIESETEEMPTLDAPDINNKNIITGELQLDNGLLPLAPAFPSKFERHFLECRQESMQFPCKRNQKWFCQNINGRWRKHKCKSITLPTLDVKSYKKCACIAPHGIVYKNLPIIQANVTKRHARIARLKRDIEEKLTKRERRDTLAHVENAMDDVRHKINGLKIATENATLLEESAIKTNLETNIISESIPGCVIDKGTVNCPTAIYHDRKTWRKSRHHIENEIQQLKHKLEKLKEIRRHLKQAKPTEEEEAAMKNNNKTNLLDLNEFNNVKLTPLHNIPHHFPTAVNLNGSKANKKKRKQRIHHENNPKIKIESELELNSTIPMENDLKLTTHAPNHHRHDHHKPDASATTAAPPLIDKEICHCEEVKEVVRNEIDLAREEKRRLKEERQKRKMRKQKKKLLLEKECSSERMNCFHHDNDHWKTAPLWTVGPFCFCMNANNNTYSCVRTINATHNFLYCEFTTGLVTFYNLRMDPFELHNRVDKLKPEERSYLHDLLKHLVACKGKSCTVNHNQHVAKARTPNTLPLHNPVTHQRYQKRKFVADVASGDHGAEGKVGNSRLIRVDTRGKGRNNTMNIRLAFRQDGIRRRRKSIVNK